MTVEKFIIPDVVKLDDDGKMLEFTYSDIFDPEVLIGIVSNPDTPPETRDKIKNRLFQARVKTIEELNKLVPKPS